MTYILRGSSRKSVRKWNGISAYPRKVVGFSSRVDLSCQIYPVSGINGESEQDSLFEEDVLKIVATMCKLDAKTSRQFLKQMVEEGLLVNSMP